ncbi:MAG: DUF4251 domain-containing protein [Prevotella sp.]|nr:DUF4251 domain-containing protein [Prevotella sp.]
MYDEWKNDYERADGISFGGGKGLNFSATIANYSMTQSKDGRYLIKMNVDNGEDEMIYQLEIFSNGRSYVSVWAKERDPISYTGEIE